jgi:hypothetical protein
VSKVYSKRTTIIKFTGMLYGFVFSKSIVLQCLKTKNLSIKTVSKHTPPVTKSFQNQDLKPILNLTHA